LASAEAFWKLVQTGIITAETCKAGGWNLKGSCYVGRALLGDVLLEVHEKFSGSFEKLLSLGPARAPLVAKASAPVTPDPLSTPLLISLFIRAAKTYLSGLKLTRYVARDDQGTLASGRLDIRRTVQLRAKGMMHQVAFTRTVLSADLPINQAVYAALREIEFIARVTPVASQDLASARALSTSLSECLPSVWKARKGSIQDKAIEAAGHAGLHPVIRDVTSLAVAVLDSAGFGGATSWTRTVERSWFVNLETQFEDAVRAEIKRQMAPEFSVTGPIRRPALFDPDPGRYAANPDIVVTTDGSTAAIGDAKYKEFAGWPSAGDVHELLSHAAAYKSPKAFFVFPHEEEFICNSLGRGATGCEVWAFGVTFDRFQEDLAQVLSLTGLRAELPESGANSQ
jgi:hypothetical protein